jgi:type VI secretion system protein ImpL
MGSRLWLRITVAIVGALALMALIWWALPLIAIGGSHPLDSDWLRASLCVLVAVVVAGVLAFGIYRRRSAVRALEAGLATSQESADDAEVLKEGMKDALATLRKARGAKGGGL